MIRPLYQSHAVVTGDFLQCTEIGQWPHVISNSAKQDYNSPTIILPYFCSSSINFLSNQLQEWLCWHKHSVNSSLFCIDHSSQNGVDNGTTSLSSESMVKPNHLPMEMTDKSCFVYCHESMSLASHLHTYVDVYNLPHIKFCGLTVNSFVTLQESACAFLTISSVARSYPLAKFRPKIILIVKPGCQGSIS